MRAFTASFIVPLFPYNNFRKQTDADITLLLWFLIVILKTSIAKDCLKDTSESGNITREEFPEVVKEAWGQIPELAFSDRLSELYKGHQGVAPLDGDRVVLFVGRTSPAGWALRGFRNMWPYALRSCQIFQNVCDNPDLNPENMKAWMSDYHASPEKEVEGVAKVAAENGPESEGGLVLRLDPVDVAEGRPSTEYVPLRGRPSNKKPGFFSFLGF
ncbi:ANK2 [Symbiodinium natans]|uniref:ANK2 protein n=1 Tax=Symbiodinium natans TaxID=878477 RepID=A0A812LMD4_9DINO|nr:ANK2 [Symbiodinium natans]